LPLPYLQLALPRYGFESGFGAEHFWIKRLDFVAIIHGVWITIFVVDIILFVHMGVAAIAVSTLIRLDFDGLASALILPLLRDLLLHSDSCHLRMAIHVSGYLRNAPIDHLLPFVLGQGLLSV